MAIRRKKVEPQKKDPGPQLRINNQIRAKEVRLVGDNVTQGIYPIQQARRIAEEQELDLVEIAANAEPPVCRVLDYQKYLYQQKKKAKEIKANQTQIQVKEVRFGPQTDDHDYNFKLKHAIGFLEEGNKVKASVFFRGRSIMFKDQGELLLLRFASELESYAIVEQMPTMEGKRMGMVFSPKKGVVKKKSSGSNPADVEAQKKKEKGSERTSAETPADEVGTDSEGDE